MSRECSTCQSRSSCATVGDPDSCDGGSCSTGTCSSGPRLPPGITDVYDLDGSVERGTMVWAETYVKDGILRVHEAVPELLAEARRLSDERVFAVLMGGADARLLCDELFSFGADNVYHVRGAGAGSYDPTAYAVWLSQVVARVKPSSLLIAATPEGREMAPRLAAVMGCGLTADCTGLHMEDGNLHMTRPAFGGNVSATIVSSTLPAMATVRPGAFRKTEPDVSRKGTVITWPVKSPLPRDEVSAEEDLTDGMDDIAEYDVLISLGRGMCTEEDFHKASELASLLDGTVSCSRGAVETGGLDMWRQVGQTGRTVRPRVYMAFGISGALQHRVGMTDAETVISINKDPDAPIHSVSDLAIVADGRQVMESMIKILREKTVSDRK